MHAWFSLIPEFLRAPDALWEEVRTEKDLAKTAVRLGGLAALCLATYGFVLGLSHGWLQAVSSAAKMPLLILATILFCLPALHCFSLALLRTPLKLLSTTAVVLSGIGVTAFLLLGLSPVTLFFVLTSENYPFFQLLAVVFVAVSGVIGLIFIWRGMAVVHAKFADNQDPVRRIILSVWTGLYGFVATQMTWRLSPLVGDPQMPFVILRPSRDNFYMDVINALQKALGFSSASQSGIGAFFFVAGGFCLAGLFFAVFVISAVLGKNRRRRIREPAGSQANQ
jgi:hypothetical protein